MIVSSEETHILAAMSSTRIAIPSSTQALSIVGSWLSQLIIQECFLGANAFEAFRELGQASPSSLSTRLKSLMASGIIEGRELTPGSTRKSYHLTKMGEGLFNWVALKWCWDLRWEQGRATGVKSLVHTTCGNETFPLLHCAHCHEGVPIRNNRYKLTRNWKSDESEPQKFNRARTKGADGLRSREGILDLTADRWAGLIIGAQYFGLRRFDDIQTGLGIATNILTDRLTRLTRASIFERRIYSTSPARYEYWLTTKGKELYPQGLALMFWGDDWLYPGDPPIIVTHQPCGKRLRTELVCNCCGAKVNQTNVEVVRTRQVRRLLGT
jgi:DNA-binding HxlR family transcriptional regulator